MFSFLCLLRGCGGACLSEAFARKALTDAAAISNIINDLINLSLDYHVSVLYSRNKLYRTDFSSMDRTLIIDLDDKLNIRSFLALYKLLGNWTRLQIKSLELLRQAALVVQVFIVGLFFAVSFIAPQFITLNVLAYLLLQILFCLAIIFRAFRECVKVNDLDTRVGSKCKEICALLELSEKGDVNDVARVFRSITIYLETAKVVEAKMWGVKISRERVAKIMLSFLAATASALIRSGIN